MSIYDIKEILSIDIEHIIEGSLLVVMGSILKFV